jgi:hypothetical protein
VWQGFRNVPLLRNLGVTFLRAATNWVTNETHLGESPPASITTHPISSDTLQNFPLTSTMQVSTVVLYGAAAAFAFTSGTPHPDIQFVKTNLCFLYSSMYVLLPSSTTTTATTVIPSQYQLTLSQMPPTSTTSVGTTPTSARA